MKKSNVAYSLAMVFVTMLALCIFTVGYVSHAIQQNNQPTCDVVAAMTAPQPLPPNNPAVQPSTQYGRDLQAYNDASAAYDRAVVEKLHVLIQKYNCK